MSGSELTPNSPAQQPPAMQANPTDILLADQLDPDGVTYTTRGLPAALLASLLAGFLQVGAQMRVGQGMPANTVGNNGDIYFDSQYIAIYGPKAAGAWPSPGTSLVGGLVASVVGQQGVVTAAQISTALNTVATGLVANGTTPETATPCTASSNTFTTVAVGGYAVLEVTEIGEVTDILNRAANPLLFRPPPGWQFENFGVDQPIEVDVWVAGAGGGFARVRNESEGLCRVLSS